MTRLKGTLQVLIGCLGILVICSPASAAPQRLVQTRANAEQAGLVLELDQGQLTAIPCSRKGCDTTQALKLDAPPEVTSKLTPAQVTKLKLGASREVLHIKAPVGQLQWEAVVYGGLLPEGGVQVAFSGPTGFQETDTGERRGEFVQLSEAPGGESQLILGKRRADVTLCGRSALLQPKVLLPRDLRLHKIKLQRLDEQERSLATQLKAEATPFKLSSVPVLNAKVASSSANGSPAAVSDANPSTYWAENRGAEGRGEFVVMDASEQLPITGFTLVLPALKGTKLAAPAALWVATDKQLYSLELPKVNALPAPQAFSVSLPKEERTSCVALVLDGAQVPVESEDAPPNAEIPKHAQVAVAELVADVAVDEQRVLQALRALELQGPEVAEAQAFLEALGSSVLPQLLEMYPRYSAVGRARALNVMDTLPCELAGAGYALAVEQEPSTESDHAMRRLRECGAKAAKPVAKAIKHAEVRRLVELAHWLAKADPERAVKVLLRQLKGSRRSRRRLLRDALSAALASKKTDKRVMAYLEGKKKLRRRALIDLMRSLKGRIVDFKEPATARINQLLAEKPSYRTRYLLLEPIAQLAPQDPKMALLLGQAAKTDPDLPIRARAASLLPAGAGLDDALVNAVSDSQVRVREAAVNNLEKRALPAAQGALEKRLREDKWPLVRAASVRALAVLPASKQISKALAETAEDDDSPSVRRPAVVALGTLHARQYTELLRERLDDTDEDMHVRAAAASALGQMCDSGSAELLTKYASRLKVMTGIEADNVIGRASLVALGRLAPRDLKARLAGFSDKNVPVWAQRVAEDALRHPEPCKSR